MNLDEIRNVTDIIDIEYLQDIQDAVGNLTGITTAVLDPNGVPVTRPTNLYAFCEMMQASESGIKMCMQTNAQLIDINQKTHETAIVICPNSGLKTAAVPIFLGDKYLGAFLIGQLRTDDVDNDLIERTSVAAGLSAETAKRNMNMLPVIGDHEFQNILSVLEVVTNVVTRLVNTNNEVQKKNNELTELTKRLNNSVRTFRDFIDLTDVGAYLIDYDTGELLLFNNVYANLMGMTIDELQHANCYAKLGFDSWCPFCPHDQLLDESGEPGEPYIWENFLEQKDMWLRITSRAIRWIDGRLAIMVTFIDITDRKKQEEQLAYIAYYDQRLDIPNGMRLFMDIAIQHDHSPYMICIDVQGLRKINDVYGRETGDRLLSNIVGWVAAIEGYQQQIYRVDGDEFVILVSGTDAGGVNELAQKIWDRFDSPWEIATDETGGIVQHIFAQLTMGIVPAGSFDSYAELVTSIERIIDTAREQKEPVVYTDKIDEDFRQHLLFEINLKQCVLDDMNGFYLNYQPIVDPQSGRWVGMEALCRWKSPDFGEVSPVIFIPEIEQLGLIGIVGEWVLRESTRQAKAWGLDRIDHFVLDVNLSPIQLNDRQLGDRFERIIKATGFPPEKLSLEITESAEVQFDDHIMESLERLRAAGIALSLDDFGTGYASFSSLNNLPVSIIKTDRSFVQNLEKETYLQSTFQIMVEFAHAAGLRVIAEGVETKEQVDILTNIGVDLFQGYYYSRPLSAEDMGNTLESFGIS